MKKQIIITTIILIFAMQFIFALNAGEEIEVPFSDIVRNCYIKDSDNLILNNSYEEGLNFTMSGNKVLINTNPLLIPDNYTVVCEVRGFKEEQSSSGGGSAPSGWTARYGYNTPNKINKTNETKEDNSIQNETIIKEEVLEDNEIIDKENKTNRNIFWIILSGVIVCITVIYYLIKKMKGGKNGFIKKEEI